jgi:hypothetical protein
MQEKAGFMLPQPFAGREKFIDKSFEKTAKNIARAREHVGLHRDHRLGGSPKQSIE